MARERSLHAEWTQFRMLDIAHNAPPVQLREMQKAFYAGAASAMAITGTADGANISPSDLRLIYRALLDEVEHYLRDFKKNAKSENV